ncbi:assimilatory sulfite reductase (NADPH) hemoprotein subunit [Draconibacterium halophilum]|uniref:Sulfite reductase [NADPH] hemoprotein beta-component n=1 Tax=Draconibacterium halophilum TaxID=2706887 RepID=A0A6C0RAC4_9BACT|nr:assimilatory sulfite reductase (NADPH) hemoprotein subunit [Draconibacterium halophilum]QIA07340.1 assimilatory sulfite reductase (NADPH) hemoprotein subunit [Draconibacterium halophilum]
MSENINWQELSEVEKLKYESNFLRGTLPESLSDPITGAISDGDTQISKFHGIYQQSDRDIDKERKSQKLEPAYSFLIRLRMPGGKFTPEQWLKMDELSEKYANGTLKLTTRQTFQLHGVLKRNLKATIKGMNDSLMDTIAACGDVNRNVMSHANPAQSSFHAEVIETAKKISEHLLPKTNAYHEIWLDKKLVADSKEEVEPLYGNRYLPRKFKIGIVIPPHNDCDVFSQDLGFIAIIEDGKIVGYNIAVGGGLGTTFGKPETYPRTGTVIGFCTPDQIIDVAEKVVAVQRDNGNRKDRKQARLKYTIDRIGVEEFTAELTKYLGSELEPERPYSLDRNGDDFGWIKGSDKKWHLTYFVEGGRVLDRGEYKLKTALREISQVIDGDIILTGNQNLIISGVSTKAKNQVDALLNTYGVSPEDISGLRKNSIACVALPTCPLAFAEAERYLPDLVSKIETILNEHELGKEEIVIRMTGCPNGCGRPYLAEIGLIGKSPGYYNLYLGGSFNGSRLNTLYKQTINEEEILNELRLIIADFAANRKDGEHFGDFVIRKNYVEEIKEGKDFKH